MPCSSHSPSVDNTNNNSIWRIPITKALLVFGKYLVRISVGTLAMVNEIFPVFFSTFQVNVLLHVLCLYRILPNPFQSIIYVPCYHVMLYTSGTESTINYTGKSNPSLRNFLETSGAPASWTVMFSPISFDSAVGRATG